MNSLDATIPQEDESARPDTSIEALVERANVCEPTRAATRHCLNSLLNTKVLPELAGATIAAANGNFVGDADTDEFAQALLDGRLAHAESQLACWLSQGHDLEHIVVDVFTATAQHFGRQWIDDNCSFVDVTIATGNLQHLLHSMSAHPDLAPPRTPELKLLLSPAPDEQHTFGIEILDWTLRRTGWAPQTILETPTAEALSKWVKNTHYDVVGLSLNSNKCLTGLTSMIARLKRSSINQELIILVGGRVFQDCETLVSTVGADHFARDARDTLSVLQSIARLRAISGG